MIILKMKKPGVKAEFTVNSNTELEVKKFEMEAEDFEYVGFEIREEQGHLH